MIHTIKPDEREIVLLSEMFEDDIKDWTNFDQLQAIKDYTTCRKSRKLLSIFQVGGWLCLGSALARLH